MLTFVSNHLNVNKYHVIIGSLHGSLLSLLSSLQVNFCETLWCRIGDTCLTKMEAPADGTLCGTRQVVQQYIYMFDILLELC